MVIAEVTCGVNAIIVTAKILNHLDTIQGINFLASLRSSTVTAAPDSYLISRLNLEYFRYY